MTVQELEKLAEEVEKGSEAAEEQLARHFSKTIYSVAIRRGFPHDDALEIVQETLDAVFTKLRKHEFRRECKLSTFVYRIARNQCSKYIRTETRLKSGGTFKHISIEECINRLADDPFHSSPLALLTRKEIKAIVQQCVEALENPEYRKVFELILQEYERPEISKMLGIPVERYDAITCYGRKKLKTCIEQKI